MKKYSLLLPLLCLCGCAIAQPDTLPPVIDNSSYPYTAPLPSNTAVAPVPNNVLELIGRVDQLQNEVQQLTGKVEEQGNQINELKKQLSTVSSDVDEKLRNTENKSATSASPPAAETVTTPPAETQLAEPATPPAVPVEPATPTVEPVVKPVQATIPAPKQEVQASGGEKQVYQQAYSSLRSGKTDQSIEQFKAYISQYPDGGYIDIAHYWLGEAYRVKPDANSARQAYNTVLEKYPNSTKVAESLLKLGYIEIDEKNNDKAREYLNRVTSEFPNTPAAHSAQKKLQQLK
jgi:tol-pal system protein YbgF